MIVRKATPKDVPEGCQLLNEIIRIGGTTAFEEPLDTQEFSLHFLDRSQILACFVCETQNEGIVGFQALTRNKKLEEEWADIATFAQAGPKIKGVGTSLFVASREFAQATGVPVINATIRADNESGLAYYSKMGFVDYKVDKAILLKDGTPIDRISKRYDVT